MHALDADDDDDDDEGGGGGGENGVDWGKVASPFLLFAVFNVGFRRSEARSLARCFVTRRRD